MFSKIKQNRKTKAIRFSIIIFLFLIFAATLLLFTINTKDLNNNVQKEDIIMNDKELPNISSMGYELNLTYIDNGNNSRYYHNTTVVIKGILYEFEEPDNPISNEKIGLIIDGILYPNFNNNTNLLGEFVISNFTIPYSLDIYSSHIIKANFTDYHQLNTRLNNFYEIYVNATSYFDISANELSKPQLAGGNYQVQGTLRYSYNNGDPLTNKPINYYWENASLQKWPNDTIYSGLFDGSIGDIPIPDDGVSDKLTLNLTYFGVENRINSSQKVMFMSVNLYRNITCQWNTVGSATEGDTITIRGRIISGKLPYPQINFTEVRLKFSGQIVGTIFTDSNGNFAISYQIPEGTAGNNIITVEIAQDSSVYSNNAHSISIEEAPVEEDDEIAEDDDETPPPFFNFFLVFIPIVIGVAAGFAIYCVFFLRKQKKESLVVFLPLEGKIRNLKILKDTGRLEESLSYLFNAIYMELVNGKYGRKKKVNETIRDFAIISVKEFKLPPTIIYPFITKVEEYIYSRPFEITDQDFYSIVELFSPIYFELTNYHFVLNF